MRTRRRSSASGREHDAHGPAIRACGAPPKVWINASGIGYIRRHRRRGQRRIEPGGDDFTAEICLAWERAQNEAETPTHARSRCAPASFWGVQAAPSRSLPSLQKLFLGGSVGNEAVVLLIDLRDLTRLFLWAVQTDERSGQRRGAGGGTEQGFDGGDAERAHRPGLRLAPAFLVKIAPDSSSGRPQTDVATWSAGDSRRDDQQAVSPTSTRTSTRSCARTPVREMKNPSLARGGLPMGPRTTGTSRTAIRCTYRRRHPLFNRVRAVAGHLAWGILSGLGALYAGFASFGGVQPARVRRIWPTWRSSAAAITPGQYVSPSIPATVAAVAVKSASCWRLSQQERG